MRGWPLRLIDTAGVRSSTDPLEQAGIDRTLRQYERADLILHVYDATRAAAAETLGRARARCRS